MAKEVGKQAGFSAASGATTGAAAGSLAGPWGAAIGAVVGGALGAISGAFRGSAQRKAKRYQKLAAQIQQQREENQDYARFLQLIRQQRLARASTLASAVASGLDRSSAVSGSISGQQSQTAYSINYLAEDRRLQSLYLSYMRSAGKAASIERDQTALWSSVLALAQPFAQAGAKQMGQNYAKTGDFFPSSTTGSEQAGNLTMTYNT
jgi:hypothetical protein